jgi:membrane protease YdiL (CAAX protease family)
MAVWGVLLALHRTGAIAEPSALVSTLLGGYGFHGTLLLAGLWQGRRVGGGDWRAGIGANWIRRKGWVALLCVVTVGWLMTVLSLAAAIPALHDFMKSMTPEFLMSDLGEASPAVMALLLVLVAILAPVAEECFFRGWLWEASRRRGHAIVTTACLTAVPWLLLHGIESPGRILFLLPAAVIFSFARQMGGSVFASLTVHMTNNLSVVAVQAAAALLGPQ